MSTVLVFGAKFFEVGRTAANQLTIAALCGCSHQSGVSNARLLLRSTHPGFH